jgi:hypothetical protein
MDEEKAVAQNITLYPSHVEKVERLMRIWKIRKFSQAIQRLVDDAPEPQTSVDNNQAVVARP